MFQKRRLERNAPGRAAYRAERKRQEEWSKNNANPKADKTVIILLWIFALMLISLFFAPRLNEADQTEMTPKEHALANRAA